MLLIAVLGVVVDLYAPKTRSDAVWCSKKWFPGLYPIEFDFRSKDAMTGYVAELTL